MKDDEKPLEATVSAGSHLDCKQYRLKKHIKVCLLLIIASSIIQPVLCTNCNLIIFLSFPGNRSQKGILKNYILKDVYGPQLYCSVFVTLTTTANN